MMVVVLVMLIMDDGGMIEYLKRKCRFTCP